MLGLLGSCLCVFACCVWTLVSVYEHLRLVGELVVCGIESLTAGIAGVVLVAGVGVILSAGLL